MNDAILVTRENTVAVITFNRPEKMNACNREMMSYFSQICEEINADDSIHVVLIKGAGDSFTVGNDLHELNRDIDIFSSEALSFVRQFNACILLLREMTKIVVVAAHGMVMGIGMCLVLAADLVIASHNARFSLGFQRLALSPIGAVSYLLPRTLGTKRAMQLLMLSEALDATTALSMGLVNWIVPQEELIPQTEKTIKELQEAPTMTLYQTKQLVNSSFQHKLTAQLEFEAESFVRCVNTEAFKVAIHDFIDHHTPAVEGK